MSSRALCRLVLVSFLAPLALACGDDADAEGSPNADAALADGGADAGTDAGDASRTPAAIQQGTRITLADGQLEGEVVGDARRFLGIPYAEPPLGELRFAAPVKVAPWSQVRDATEFGGRCAQPTSVNTGAGTDNEDCLYLNVWTPNPAPSEPLPVLFWIHGGGNQNGATSDLVPVIGERPFYDGQSFAENHDVVVVSVNYRLGPLGYMAHPALRAEGSPSGNQGLLDQRLAMQWVRDNVAAFGGDPNEVTIFGESAGARNVCYHVVSPGSRGLFRRAISQSGDCLGRAATQAEAEAQNAAFVQAVGCDDAEDELACLRELPAGALIIDEELEGGAPSPVPGGSAYGGGRSRWDFRPVVDGEVVPDQPRAMLEAGDVEAIPYIMGTNSEEGALSHLTAPPVTTEAEYLQALERRFGAFADEVAALYPASAFESPNAALIRVSTDFRYACAVQEFAERASAAGLTVYAYNFDMPYAIPGLDVLGAAHAAELSYVFASLPGDLLTPEQQAVSELMQRYWSRFAHASDPNAADAPEWTEFDAETGDRLNIDAEPEMVDAFRAERCAVWQAYYATAFE